MSSATARRPHADAPAASRSRAANDVIAGVRVVPREAHADHDDAALERLDTHVQRYIEAHWLGGLGSSRRHLRLRPLGYALLDAASRPELAVAVTEFARRMGDFLFGAGPERTADILVHVAESRDVALFLHAAPQDARALALNPNDADTAVDLDAPDAAASDDDGDDPDEAQEADAAAGAPAMGEADLGFVGVYDVRHHVIIASAAVLTAPLATPAGPLDPAAYADSTGRALEDVHALTLDGAEAERTRPRPGGAPLIYAPVDYSVIAQPAQLQRLLDAAGRLTARGLGLILCGAPNFAPHERLRTAMRHLMTRFRFIDWEVSAGHVEAANFAGAGLHSITLALPHSEIDGRFALHRFLANATALRANRLRIGVRGVRDAASLARCVEAGVDFVAGPAVTPIATRAFTPRRAAIADLPAPAPSDAA